MPTEIMKGQQTITALVKWHNIWYNGAEAEEMGKGGWS